MGGRDDHMGLRGDHMGGRGNHMDTRRRGKEGGSHGNMVRRGDHIDTMRGKGRDIFQQTKGTA